MWYHTAASVLVLLWVAAPSGSAESDEPTAKRLRPYAPLDDNLQADTTVVFAVLITVVLFAAFDISVHMPFAAARAFRCTA